MQPDANPLLAVLRDADSNPLLAKMPPKLEMLDLARALRNRPISPKFVSEVDFSQRHKLIDVYKSIVVPTGAGIKFVSSLQHMLYQGLASRNPQLEANRRRIFENSGFKGADVSAVPWFPSFAAGAILEAITGMGKSQILDRYLSLLPQVIEHGHEPACGWAKLRQLVFLKVHMPSDGSRGGFLESAFLALDEALGSSYRSEFKRWTVERKIVVLLHLLSLHRCGLLVIEEAQERNLAHTAFAREFQTFFLRVLNWGIPTVVLGNPLAFTELKNFSQDVDRFSEGGWHVMQPVQDPQDDEWVKHWIPGLWNPTLLDEPDTPYSPLADAKAETCLEQFLWNRTAGIPRYLCRLRREVQKRALFAQEPISTEMIDTVYRTSEAFEQIRPRIEAMVARDWKALQRFSDIPVSAFRTLGSHDQAPGEKRLNAGDEMPTRKSGGASRPKRKSSRKNDEGLFETSSATALDKDFQESLINSLTSAASQAAI